MHNFPHKAEPFTFQNHFTKVFTTIICAQLHNHKENQTEQECIQQQNQYYMCHAHLTRAILLLRISVAIVMKRAEILFITESTRS